jgi:hypothetical protein
MRSPAFIAIGLGFILMGVGLFALTLKKPKNVPANPTKSQLREQAALADENRKMRTAAGVVAGLGALMCGVFLF